MLYDRSGREWAAQCLIVQETESKAAGRAEEGVQSGTQRGWWANLWNIYQKGWPPLLYSMSCTGLLEKSLLLLVQNVSSLTAQPGLLILLMEPAILCTGKYRKMENYENLANQFLINFSSCFVQIYFIVLSLFSMYGIVFSKPVGFCLSKICRIHPSIFLYPMQHVRECEELYNCS